MKKLISLNYKGFFIKILLRNLFLASTNINGIVSKYIGMNNFALFKAKNYLKIFLSFYTIFLKEKKKIK